MTSGFTVPSASRVANSASGFPASDSASLTASSIAAIAEGGLAAGGELAPFALVVRLQQQALVPQQSQHGRL
ncbi:hypothetical protein [Kitasatospora setae]|uniref:hypothetical protein n=1 Tax=Kitasatospora setae TaxID=2066 RepID=UPI001B804777|nr:hypothetical protein [Kitasatospora setae]